MATNSKKSCRHHKLSPPEVKTSSFPAYFFSDPNWVSPLAKRMMEAKHSHSAKCLLLPPSSPLHYDSPLLRSNAKAASLSAGALLQKALAHEEKKKARKEKVGGERRKSAGDGESGESSSTKKAPEERLNRTLDSSMSSTLTRSRGGVYDDEDVNCTVFEVEEFGSKRWIHVEVIEPVIITAKNFLHLSTSFTTYLIRIETNHYAFSLPVSEIRRRYSDFVWLRQKLGVHHPNKVIPPLPPKHFFNIVNFNGKIINQRRFGLGKFLQRVFRSSVLLSDSALHFFLQSDLTTKEIDARVSEERQESEIQIGNGYGANNNNIPLTPSISIDKSPLGQARPYLFRSVSLSSSAASGEESDGGNKEGGRGCGRHSDQDCEDYCDISSSEEYKIDVEAC